MASFVGSREQLLAKSLPNRSHHKGCMWAHESRADLEPLRFSTHERNGVGSESGLAGEQFSHFFSLVFPLGNFGHKLVLLLPWALNQMEWLAKGV